MPLRSGFAIATALIFVLGLLYLRTAGGQVFTTESQRRWQIETQQPAISNWQLQDHNGKVFTLADLEKQGVLIDFIFTRCMTICRAAGSRYAQIQQRTSDWEQRPLLLSISIDPLYDTPQQLTDYRKRYTQQPEGWLVARPIDQLTLETIKRETGITVIPDAVNGFAHTDSFHWAREQRLLRVLDWADREIVSQLK